MSDYEVTQRRRNLIVGLFVLLGLVALVWLIFKFQDLPVKVSEIRSFDVNVQFPTAKGVQTNAPVEFCGYQIGRVTSVMAPEILKDRNTGLKYYQTKVILSIDKRYVDIPSIVDVKLMTRSLGSSYIELQVNPYKPLTPLDPNIPETKYLRAGMLLQGSTGMTSEFFPEESQKKLEKLISGLETFIGNANSVIGDRENKDNVKKTLAHLAEASKQAIDTQEKFREFISAGTSAIGHVDANIADAIASFLDTSKSFQEFATTGTSTLKNVDSKADKLIAAMVETSSQISSASSQLRLMLEKMNNGQGTAGRFLNDGRFYENLLENTEQLKALLQEMKLLIDQAHEKGLGSVW